MVQKNATTWVHEPSCTIPNIVQYENEDQVQLDRREEDLEGEHSKDGNQTLESRSKSNPDDISSISKRLQDIEDKQNCILFKFRRFINSSSAKN